MMGEWKYGLIIWRPFKMRPPSAINNERRQDPHPAPAVAGLLEQNPVAPNNQRVRFEKSFRFGSRISYRECSRIFCAAKCFDGAHIASRLPSDANKRTKIEQC
jgi:hypothetical protein